MTIGERIKQRRLELGITQEELAKKAGYKSRSSVNKIELSRDLPLTKVQSVAKILECSPAYLMGWEDKNDIIESADIDTELILMDEQIKEYAIKLSKLSEEDKKDIMKMIDRF